MKEKMRVAEWHDEIDRKNHWGIVVLWRGIREEEINYQVQEVVDTNHKLRLVVARED